MHPKDPEFPPCGVDDMTRLAYLHEAGVLQNLRCRYEMKEIYVSINPKFCVPSSSSFPFVVHILILKWMVVY